jgi:benzoyl-CoA 2,3-dioxygenase component B
MFVGESGVSRIIQRTCQLMNEHKTDDVRKFGGIDLQTVQKYLNFHYSICLDLFGQELSTNAANFYTMGLKGRFLETKIDDDHVLADASYKVPEVRGDSVVEVDAPALNAINERLRSDYIVDSQRGIDRWNRVIDKAGIDFRFILPHMGFNRRIGAFAGASFTPDGKHVDAATWENGRNLWMPSDEDFAFVASLMQAVTEPGKMASWIAPPARGINGQPLDFDYVCFN